MSKEQLNAHSWIQAGFRALTKGGIGALRAEAIARELKVSKGSFYWHFKGIPAFKSAMLTHWHDLATMTIIDDVNAQHDQAYEKLEYLIKRATDGASEPYGGVQVEAAIRDWARYDVAAEETLNAVDKARLGFLEETFSACGLDGAAAQSSANIFYAALIGLENIHTLDSSKISRDLSHLLSALVRPKE